MNHKLEIIIKILLTVTIIHFTMGLTGVLAIQPHGIRMTENAAFVKRSDVTLNPNYVTITRAIDTSGWRHTTTVMHEVLEAHNNVCKTYKDLAKPATTHKHYMALYLGKPGTLASQLCHDHGMLLPEIRDFQEYHILQQAMKKFNLTTVPAGIHTGFDDAKYIPHFDSDNAIAEHVIFEDEQVCLHKYYYYWSEHQTPDIYENYIWMYTHLNDDKLTVCPDQHVRENVGWILCINPNKEEPGNQGKMAAMIASNLDRCNKDNFRMATDLSQLNAVITSANKEPGSYTKWDSNILNNTYSPLIRDKRYVELMLPLLKYLPNVLDLGARVINYFTTEKTMDKLRIMYNVQDARISALELHTPMLYKRINDIEEQLPTLITAMRQIQFNLATSITELDIKALFRELQNGLYNNVFSYGLALNLANAGIMTDTLLPQKDLLDIQEIFKIDHNVDIITDITAINPFLSYGQGSINITYAFPIKSPERKATIYSMHPIPSFSGNMRITPLMEHEFLAFTRTGSYFTPLTLTEASQCMAQPNQCNAARPLTKPKTDMCGIGEFFGLPSTCTYLETADDSPFFLTFANTTIFSVPHPTKIYTHCPSALAAGPELVSLIEAKGFISTENSCYLESEDVLIYPSNGVAKTEIDQLRPQQQTKPSLIMITNKTDIGNLQQLPLLDFLQQAPPLNWTTLNFTAAALTINTDNKVNSDPIEGGWFSAHTIISYTASATAFILLAITVYCLGINMRHIKIAKKVRHTKNIANQRAALRAVEMIEQGETAGLIDITAQADSNPNQPTLIPPSSATSSNDTAQKQRNSCSLAITGNPTKQAAILLHTPPQAQVDKIETESVSTQH